ncbi:MAG: uridine diphosphate-N-acetylglucosamine-binding protein YvcK [Candidatus Nanopelagicales bacterium]|nr:uridine diphosphate-N-acetylglucosamine-binding protein YvcK [Candidatus Nanopelagicales bacterium]
MNRVPGSVPRGVHTGPAVVALGGGHGLAATLTAVRRMTDRITAVVGVADDGGSSGRLRAEFGILPPGDLRMALAALCGDDTWGRTWQRVVQHRFAGTGELGGHALGNLLITALWEETGDAVTGLDWVGSLLEAQGRVLPCSLQPLQIVAQVRGVNPHAPDVITEVRGQEEVATTPGDVVSIAIEPARPQACPEALAAVHEADVIILGPGSWFTSVLPHLLIPELARAIMDASAKRVLVMNLAPDDDSETAGIPVARHLEFLRAIVPGMRLDAVIADPRHVDDAAALADACAQFGAALVLEQVAHAPGRNPGAHDPDRLAVALRTALHG